MPTCTHPRMATCAGGFWKLSAPCGWKAVVEPRDWKEPVQKHAVRWQQSQALNTASPSPPQPHPSAGILFCACRHSGTPLLWDLECTPHPADSLGWRMFDPKEG